MGLSTNSSSCRSDERQSLVAALALDSWAYREAGRHVRDAGLRMVNGSPAHLFSGRTAEPAVARPNPRGRARLPRAARDYFSRQGLRRCRSAGRARSHRSRRSRTAAPWAIGRSRRTSSTSCASGVGAALPSSGAHSPAQERGKIRVFVAGRSFQDAQICRAPDPRGIARPRLCGRWRRSGTRAHEGPCSRRRSSPRRGPDPAAATPIVREGFSRASSRAPPQAIELVAFPGALKTGGSRRQTLPPLLRAREGRPITAGY